MRINDNHESAKRLFAEHVAARFPDECEDLEIAGVDLEELNGTAVGCVAPFVGRSGYQAVHENELRRCREDLDAILPRLSGYSRAYYTRLRTLVKLVLELSGGEAGRY
jgi:hypothetical protein